MKSCVAQLSELIIIMEKEFQELSHFRVNDQLAIISVYNQ